MEYTVLKMRDYGGNIFKNKERSLHISTNFTTQLIISTNLHYMTINYLNAVLTGFNFEFCFNYYFSCLMQ